MNVKIFIPLSRKDRVKQIHTMLKNTNYRVQDNYSLLLVVDNPQIQTHELERLFKPLFRNLSIVHTGLPALPEMDMHKRRERITRVFELAQLEINPMKTSLVLTIEDDGDFEPHYIHTLLDNYTLLSKIDNIGFVSGVEAGRWAVKMIGAWQTNKQKDPTEIWSIPYRDNNIQMHTITACGFYFFVTSAELFKNTKLRYGDFGPDVFWGLDVSGQGFTNYIDWNLKINHITPYKTYFVNEGREQIRFKWIDNNWRMVIE